MTSTTQTRLTTFKAARKLGRTSATVRQYIREGRLSAMKAPSGRWYVDAAEVEMLLTPPGRGR
jgi:predicted site-specific integrase-resolvase